MWVELSIKISSDTLFGAHYRPDGAIHIAPEVEKTKIFTYVIFELANMTQNASFEDLYFSAIQGSITPEEYAYGCEKLEWKSMEIVLKTMELAKKEIKNVWIPNEWITITNLPDDEARWEFTKSYIPEHVEMYRKECPLKGSGMKQFQRLV